MFRERIACARNITLFLTLLKYIFLIIIKIPRAESSVVSFFFLVYWVFRLKESPLIVLKVKKENYKKAEKEF